jgi:BASS family bile acid:Na+ symporter
MLGGFEKALLAILLVILMMGMGATLTTAAFREIAKRPKGVLIGIASQFGWMPLIAFGTALALDLSNESALGLLIVGCCPGGVTSNMFTYYARADVALSVSMTAFSTVIAVVMMPLVLALYTQPFTSAELSIPYLSIVTSLALVLLPVAIGMFIRSRSERVAHIVEKVGSMSGMAVLVLLIITSVMKNAEQFDHIPVTLWLGAIVLGVLGMVLGYLGARLLGLKPAECRAVSFETGIQNSPIAFTIIILSFAESVYPQVLGPAMLYALMVLVTASIATLGFRWRMRHT